MSSICLNFQVHITYCYKIYHFFDIGQQHSYYDEYQMDYLTRRIAERCYVPANNLMLELIQRYGKKFNISFAISGVAMELFERYAPDVLESFKKLVATGQVELLGTPYYHSLACVSSSDEFKRQVLMHRKKIQEIFEVTPVNFSNTDLIYADYIGEMISQMGFHSVITEGAKHVLGWRSPNYLYNNPIVQNLKILFRNQWLSDDVSLRFSNRYWSGYPLTAEKFTDWMMLDPNRKCVTLAMDYRTVGDFMELDTGIFNFFEYFPEMIFSRTDFQFYMPSQILEKLDPIAPVYIPHEISWALAEKDLSAWLGNDLQYDFFHKLYGLDERIKKTNDEKLIEDWRRIQCADNLYNMHFRWLSETHMFEKKWNSPYEAFMNYMNIFSDLEMRVQQHRFTNLSLRRKNKTTVTTQ